MTNRLQDRERIAKEWRARVDRAREAIDRMGCRGDAAALARAEAGLEKAEAKLAAARDRAARIAKLASLRAGLEQRAEQIAAAAAKVKKRWKEERAKEPKRIKARVKELAKRVAKDKGAAPNPFRRRRTQAPAGLPEAATWPTGPIVPAEIPTAAATDPPRDGLIPGDYVDPARAQRIVGQLLDTFGGKRLPERWTPEHVSDRLVEAFRVLRRLPMVVRPKQYGAMWPEYIHDRGDAFGQTISGTLQERNRAIRGTSEDEVSRMHEALAWPMEFLGDRPNLARAVNYWAFWSDLDGDTHDDWSWEGVKIIADGLTRKNVVVR